MGFFWVFLGFYGFFWFFWVFWVFLFGTLDSCITVPPPPLFYPPISKISGSPTQRGGGG